jgi:hypothetical protein
MKRAIWLYSLFAAALLLGTTTRGWADVSPGDTITKDNFAKAEELLPPFVRWLVTQGMPIPVIETKKVHWPKAYKEATEKYAGQVKLSADGKDMFNYVAGCPFPNVDINDPLAGFKLMWNHEQRPYIIDNVGTEWIVELVNRKGEMERAYGSSFWRRMMWSGRLYTEPKPVVPHNPPIRYTEQWGPLFIPNDLKGAGVVNFRYLPPDVPDDTYMYLPELRRVRRISAANRSDAFWGTDGDIDSIGGFNAKVSYWTFRVLAEKEILAVVHSGKYGDPSQWCAPRDGTRGFLAALPCVSWEKRKVWVVEGIPTGYGGQYAYSKRILYLDQDFFGPVVAEMYDQGGELWKGILGCVFYAKKPYEGYPAKPLKGAKYDYEDEWPFTPNGLLADIQLTHATTFDAPSSHNESSKWVNEWYFNEDVSINTPEAYSVNYLIQSAR